MEITKPQSPPDHGRSVCLTAEPPSSENKQNHAPSSVLLKSSSSSAIHKAREGGRKNELAFLTAPETDARQMDAPTPAPGTKELSFQPGSLPPLPSLLAFVCAFESLEASPPLNSIPFWNRIRESLPEDHCEAERRPVTPKPRSVAADAFTTRGCLRPPRSTREPGLRAVVSGRPIREGVCPRRVRPVAVLLRLPLHPTVSHSLRLRVRKVEVK